MQPVEFTDGNLRLRHTPLAALPLIREYGRLLKRADQYNGALDTLSYLTSDERTKLFDVRDDPKSLDKIILVLRLVASLVKNDDLDALVTEYLGIGSVELLVNGEWKRLAVADGEEWKSTDALADLDDPIAPIVATARVIGRILLPLFDRLRTSTAKATEPTSGESSSSSEATSAPAATT